MPPDPEIADRLQQALGSAYRIERELGGGAMSRVFLARDTELDRRIVVKVLPPELTHALSTDRFRREIQLSARLQHPHIVPVLTAARAGDLLYYTMPFVEGETLRARIARVGALPVPECVDILRDAVRALAYAHRRGVVHRDIKPDNILLSEDSALVADFGIARAVTRAKPGHAEGDDAPVGALADAAASTLTQAGISLGTPGYMAPEQALGDPAIDHRADLYAIGVVAYEMLVGRHLFGERTPQQMMAAHAVEPPPSLAASVPDVPPALAALVMRCLQKDPAQRPQSADELLQLLQAVGTPVTGTASYRATPRRRRWRRAAVLVAAGLLVAVAGAFALAPGDKLAVVLALARRASPQLHPNRVIVAPFANETGDPRLASLGAMAADWVSRGLTGLGGLEVVDARTAAVTGEVVDRIPWPLRARDRGRALAEETGAGLIVSGVIYRDGDSLRVQARMSDAATGKLLRTLSSVSGPASAPTAVLDQLNRRVVANVAQAMDTIASSLTAYSEPPSIEAYEEMRDGIAAYLRQDSSVFTHFERAIALDSTYATPVVLLAFSRVYRGYPELAAREVARARRLLDRIAPADRAMLAHVEAQLRGDAAASLRAAEDFVRITPGSAESPLLLASIALSTSRPRLALDVLRRSDPDRGLNLGGPYYWRYTAAALLDLGRHQQALEATEQGLRRFPKNVSLLALKGRALVGLDRVRELDDLIDATPAERGARVVAQAEQAHALAAVLRASGRPAAAAALASGWLRRLDAARDSAAQAAVARMWLLVVLDRWDDAAAQARELDARPALDGALREDLASVLAAAAARRGQRAEAQRIEAALTSRAGPYDLGRVSLLRARIAAQLGERNRAAALFQQALGDGLNLTTPLHRFRHDPLLFPLLGFPGFEAHVQPAG